MIILSVDTSCEQASCAIYEDGSVTERKSPEDKRKHSSVLMPMVMDFLRETGISVSDIDIFAVGSGPGSFTGIRIGMSAMKGMALASGKPLVTVRSLDALACRYTKPGRVICPVIDARNRQVYTSIYLWSDGGYYPFVEYMGITVEDLNKRLSGFDKPVVLCGDAADEYADFLGAEADRENKYPSAAVIARMTASENSLITKGDAGSAIPFYLRESQAKRLYGKK